MAALSYLKVAFWGEKSSFFFKALLFKHTNISHQLIILMLTSKKTTYQLIYVL